MLGRIVHGLIRFRGAVIGLLVLLFVLGGVAVKTLAIDAVPDVSTIQVAVLTESPGLSPLEIERTVTFPIEAALNGTPGLVELRSVSRGGLSAVTVIFKENVDVWAARQVILERIRGAESQFPVGTGKPELSPVSSGLGEIYQFAVRSDQHSPMQLRTILDWEIVPELRSVPGIIEVNTMGGELKEFQVVVDRNRLHSHGMTMREVADALTKSNITVGGGYVDRPSESFNLTGVGRLRNEEEIANVFLRADADGTALLVKHIAQVRISAALRYGVITRNGEGEAVTGVVMMLSGANSRDVVGRVKTAIADIQRDLPAGVMIETIYDRSDFVGRTLQTVLNNLLEGALVVALVLWIFLGSLRAAIVVVLGIPASMAIALFGMHLFGVTGDLMSLGAIDFGFLVDGPIVVVEAVMAKLVGRELTKRSRAREYGALITEVAKPVGFAVAILMLVYIPLLSLQGIEGKMFRPMALTMTCALFGALVYTIVFFPALVVTFVPPPKTEGPKWFMRFEHAVKPLISGALRRRVFVIAGAVGLLVVSGVLVGGQGADFVPRIDEGDLVVTIRRAPSISLGEARSLDLKAEQVLKRYPEVLSSLGMTGRAEVAIDPVGSDNTDIFVHLRPKKEWKTARDLDGLSIVLKNAIESEVPGTFVSISQPIEDKTNELISGSRADVQIAVFGSSIEKLKELSEKIGREVKDVRGTGDVRVERLLGAPTLVVKPDRTRLAQYGVTTEDALAVVEAARVGIKVGSIYEEQRKFDLKVLVPPRAPTPEALGELYVEGSGGKSIPLSEVARVEETEGPTQIRREGMTRTVRVEVNLRGRDLVSWVSEAQERVKKAVPLDTGYSVVWGGQFENFQRAKDRLAMVVPASLAIIFLMLYLMFGDARFALAVFAGVPFALTGGIFGLVARNMPFSIPAAVGFIALAGVCVLNGVVLASDAKKRIERGDPINEALVQASVHSFRSVITTGVVAAFGFLPMALATGAGAEVQQPLATVVVFGIMYSTLLTVVVLPTILSYWMPSYREAYLQRQADNDEEPMPPVAPVPVAGE
ncbi:MAG: efflux RND transporter permease subunit [Polyangiaceae bacterium]|nr:efflux RND transporter permease subunit [Polyangiaceae bacterium]